MMLGGGVFPYNNFSQKKKNIVINICATTILLLALAMSFLTAGMAQGTDG
jgi:hypothetical protein